MSGVGALTGAVSAGVLRGAEQDTGTAVILLKKATQADKDLVATLLPPPAPTNGSVDIRA